VDLTLHQQRLEQWLTGLTMPRLDHPLRRVEELRFNQLRTFFVLLLASDPANPPSTPAEALDRFGPELTDSARYKQALQLPLHGTPDEVVSELEPGDPDSELFALQERLTDQLSDDGRLVLLRLAQLF
jgi:hypothetical protein